MRRRATTAGMTIVELAVSTTILTLVIVGLGTVLRQANQTYRAGMETFETQTSGARAFEDLVDALRLADAAATAALPEAPFSTSQLDYTVIESFDSGAREWSRPMRLCYEPATGKLVRVLDPETIDEQRVPICHGIAPLSVEEEPNGLDDDGNGLIDEPGLYLARKGGQILVGLTVLTPSAEGGHESTSWSTRITPRHQVGQGP